MVGEGGLIERESEFVSLESMIDRAAGGEGVTAMIVGPAGIGKTALLAAARERAAEAGMAVFSARGRELEVDFAWGVVRQLFDATATSARYANTRGLFDGAAALARPALGMESPTNSADALYASLHGLYWFTVNLAQRRPMCIAVDDAHWADPPTLRFLVHLLPRIAELPIVVVVTKRTATTELGLSGDLLDQVAAEPGVTTLRPAAFSETASTAMVRRTLSDEADPGFCKACHQMSGGNPFLLTSLLVDLQSEQVKPDRSSVAHVRRMTPEAVSTSVLLRLARMPPESVQLVRAIAVLGTSTGLRSAGLLAGLNDDEVAESAGALIRAEILSGERTVDFVHPLVRSAVYHDLPGPQRSRWHYTAARLLHREGAGLERVAPHLLQSLPNRDPWTVARLCEMAADARARGAPEIAADCLRRALMEPPGEELRATVLLALGQVEALRDPEAAISHLREALAHVTDRSTRAAITLALGDALTLTADLNEAVQVLSTGLGQAGDVVPDVRASLEVALINAARWEPSQQMFRHQLTHELHRRADQGETLDPRLHGQLAIEITALGVDRQAAIDHARATLVATEALSMTGTTVLPEAMLVLVFADCSEEARRAIDNWLVLAQDRAWPLAVAAASTCAALAALYRGSVGEALAAATGAVAGNAEVRLAPITVAFLVEALIEQGELDLAFTELTKHGLSNELPSAWSTTPLLLARGRLHAASGDHDAAITDLLATGQRCDDWGVRNPAMTPWRSYAAFSLARVGQLDKALAFTDEEIRLARRWGAPRAIGVALRAAGIVNGGNEGLELLREAVETLRDAPAPLELARALTDLGSALRRAGHRGEARERLRDGLDLAHQHRAIAVAERARDELTIAGARPRRNAIKGRDSLTPSELRICQLAASGQTNREIAESLFLTLRTVETHLTNSYTKLAIASRRQLPGALETTGESQT